MTRIPRDCVCMEMDRPLMRDVAVRFNSCLVKVGVVLSSTPRIRLDSEG
jgi:hypothetical protein